MKKLVLVISLLLSSISFSQNDYMKYPFEGDNRLVQIVPTIENREVSMEFVDTLLYREILAYEVYVGNIINYRYKEVLSQYKDCKLNVLHLSINPFNKDKYDYSVNLTFWSEERGSYYISKLDLYNVEMSFQKGTLKEDLKEVFEKTIIQDDKQAEYERTHSLEPLEGIKMY